MWVAPIYMRWLLGALPLFLLLHGIQQPVLAGEWKTRSSAVFHDDTFWVVAHRSYKCGRGSCNTICDKAACFLTAPPPWRQRKPLASGWLTPSEAVPRLVSSVSPQLQSHQYRVAAKRRILGTLSSSLSMRSTSATTTTTTTVVEQPTGNHNNHSHIFLLSLQWPDGSRDARLFSKTVMDMWRWKDEVLGDGRDYFLPKPKTLKALQHYLLQSSISSCSLKSNSNPCKKEPSVGVDVVLQECVILSNCARFEILVVVQEAKAFNSPASSSSAASLQASTVRLVSELLFLQMMSHQTRQKQRTIPFQLPLDWPAVIDAQAAIAAAVVTSAASATKSRHDKEGMTGQEQDELQQQQQQQYTREIQELERHWTVLAGAEAVLEHLCLVSAGMASRPRRPDRLVTFRPFSSRDAHILLQLKRTLELTIASTTTNKNIMDDSIQRMDMARDAITTTTASSGTLLLSLLLRYAIQAGKAARNPDKVPELYELRGTGNSKYAAEPPLAVSQRVAEVAKEKAIQPTVRECLETLKARESAERINSFRNRAEAMAVNSSELQWIRKRIHVPTMQLRKQGRKEEEDWSHSNNGQGGVIDEEAILMEISKELELQRT